MSIRRHNREVHAFLAEIIADKESKALHGGRLAELLDAAFEIRRLYPAGNHPKSDKTPLKWDNKEIWLKRNIEKRDESFRLRVDDSDGFLSRLYSRCT
ncbi:hypothetical protein SAMN05216315_1374 [Nitrosospira sp. Nsp18]|uniref:hypothetical protein n=1 Tax=Nitrosospira sp. Nsp18 TaxID=1855334 RepID=UPI0008926ACE|nr:hypothetical protein [Nitrosospira sp. Nsp18]SDA28159.1 hypothetical protein SAMN05216315_1374 [Nitrosospira sp. Nsp18]